MQTGHVAASIGRLLLVPARPTRYTGPTRSENLIRVDSSFLHGSILAPWRSIPRSGRSRPRRRWPRPSTRPRRTRNPELTPDHLLAALTRQDDTIVPGRAGQARPGPADGAQQGRRGRRPAAQGLRRRRAAPRAASSTPSSTPPSGSSPTCSDDFLSVEHLLLAMNDRLGVGTEELLQALQEVRGSAPRHVAEPRGAVPGARALRPGPHRAGPRGQDRPGHRARRRDPPGHPGARRGARRTTRC